MRAARVSPRAPSAILRGATLFVFVALSSVLLASCLGVLGLDEYEAAPEALCALLDRCYGKDARYAKCRGHVSSQLAASEADDRSLWLSGFSEDTCLSTCKLALGCLDKAPVCRGLRESCSSEAQCCGFTLGTATCSRQKCCLPSGVLCEKDTDCCAGGCKSSDGVSPKTCGGVVACKTVGEACSIDEDCCSSVLCDANTSLCTEPCRAETSPCERSDQCCSNSCENGSCTKCTADGEFCLKNEDCCNGVCDPVKATCGATGCRNDENPCTTDGDCCSGFCAEGAWICDDQNACTHNGDMNAPCASADECCIGHCNIPGGSDMGLCGCANGGEDCLDSFNCCSGLACLGGSCQSCLGGDEDCNRSDECCSGTCMEGDCCSDPGCSHGICSTGEPLGVAACGASANPAEAWCVARVCENAPWCCCNWWDEQCVNAVETTCNLQCL
jgi:hypothetical protein